MELVDPGRGDQGGCICSPRGKSCRFFRWLGKVGRKRGPSFPNSNSGEPRSCLVCHPQKERPHAVYCCNCKTSLSTAVAATGEETSTTWSITCNLAGDLSPRQWRQALHGELKKLAIVGCRVDSRFARMFAGSSLDNLTHLNMTGNQLYRDPRTTRIFLKALPTKSLHHLTLSWNGLEAKDVSLIARFTTNLSSLRLSGNPIRAKGVRFLLVEGNLHKIPTVDVWDCDIGDEGALLIANAMAKPGARFNSLVLDMNSIGFDGVKALSFGIVSCPPLKCLSLYCNDIGMQGARVLADALKYSKLEELDVRANQLGVEGARLLSEVLNRSCLSRLMICHNAVGDAGANYIATALSKNTRLQSLAMNVNNLSSKACKSLGAALATNTALKRLYLKENVIKRHGALEFVNVLKSANQHLVELSIVEPTYENHLVLDKLNFYLRANACGRRHWGNLSIPTSLWSKKMEAMEPEHLYWFLKERPDILVSRQERLGLHW